MIVELHFKSIKILHAPNKEIAIKTFKTRNKDVKIGKVITYPDEEFEEAD